MTGTENRGDERTAAPATFDKLLQRWDSEQQAARERARELRRRVAEDARPVFERYGVERALLFGSVAEGRCREGSDVDLLVFPLPAEYYASCWRELEDAVGAPVDLHTDAEDPVFVRKILERGEIVYAAQR